MSRNFTKKIRQLPTYIAQPIKRAEQKTIRVVIEDLSGSLDVRKGVLIDTETDKPFIIGKVGDTSSEILVKASPVKAIHAGKKYVVFGNQLFIINVIVKPHYLARLGRHSLVLRMGTSNPTSKKQAVMRIVINVKQHVKLKNSSGIDVDNIPKNQAVEALKRPWKNLAAQNIKNYSEFVPVVMAVWKRVDRLPITIVDLEHQTAKVQLILWVYNSEALGRSMRIAEETSLPVTIYNSNNIGGFGRFYAAKLLYPTHKNVIFIDDDQRLNRSSVGCLQKSHSAKTVSGDYAFKFVHPVNYWWRKKANDGEEADYIGTGGMIVDTEIFSHEELFDNIPDKYWFVEDLWLSWYAHEKLGYDIRACEASITIDIDDKNQYSSLVDTKIYFYNYLWRKGAKWSKRLSSQRKLDLGPKYEG